VRPNPLPLADRLRTNLIQAPPFLLGTIIFGSLALLASLFDKHGRVQHRIARLWAKASVWSAGSRVQVIGLENIPCVLDPSKGSNDGSIDSAEGARHHAHCAVFAANHTSYMDTPVVFASLPFQFRILAKKELWNIPFIGWYLNHSGQIPIDTANPRATLSSLGNGIRTLRDGLSVFVFPEGGRTPDGHLQPFLNGAAYLAIRAQVPLVPIALIGVYDLLPIHTRHFYLARTPLKLVIGAPISTKGRSLRESEALTEELRQRIAGLIALHI
jgi:1-acyl-sn-glycerol-3-phosphate acyltransferase